MIRQIRLLTKLSLCNLLGLNELRFTKDTGKKTRYWLFALLWLLLIILLVGYVCSLSYGLAAMGMSNLVPAALAMSVSLICFFFTTFKAGPVLFCKSTYEKQIALPVTTRAIIVSRFLSMYFTNMLLGALVMLPGMAVYGTLEKPALTFYLYGILTILFLPLLPLTAASVLGALIAGISSRWKHKNLISILLTMLLVCGILAGSLRMSGMDDSQLVTALQELALLLEAQIRSTYPPALWAAEAMTQEKPAMLALFLGVSIGCFLLFLEALRPFYGNICRLLGTRETKSNYRMKELQTKPIRRSLLERELRHYFSSSIYVVNTLMGEVLMVLLAAAVLIMGTESVESMLGMPGITGRTMPLLLAYLPAMMPTTACSISIEGRHWWMLQTLPVTKKDISRSKVTANLLIFLPFYLLSEILLLIALRPDAMSTVCLLGMPIVYMFFGARVGLAVNEKFPLFGWENEIRVVKQSASVLVSLLVNTIAALVPFAVLAACPGITAYTVYAVTTCILLPATWGIGYFSDSHCFFVKTG